MVRYAQRSNSATQTDMPVSAVIIQLDDRVLLLRRSSARQWEVPTSVINGSSPLETALTAVKKTGVFLQPDQLEPVGERQVTEPVICTYYVYAATLKERPRVNLGYSHDRAGWFHPQEAVNLSLYRETPMFLRMAFDLVR